MKKAKFASDLGPIKAWSELPADLILGTVQTNPKYKSATTVTERAADPLDDKHYIMLRLKNNHKILYKVPPIVNQFVNRLYLDGVEHGIDYVDSLIDKAIVSAEKK